MKQDSVERDTPKQWGYFTRRFAATMNLEVDPPRIPDEVLQELVEAAADLPREAAKRHATELLILARPIAAEGPSGDRMLGQLYVVLLALVGAEGRTGLLEQAGLPQPITPPVQTSNLAEGKNLMALRLGMNPIERK